MANIIPVSSMLNPIPDFNRTWREGVQFGQQQRQQSEARQREQQVRNLAPQIVSGDPAAYRQAAAIDPQAAEQFQGAGDNQLKRFKGFVGYIDRAREQAKQTGDWRHVDAALQQANPWLTQILGKPGPTAWPQGDPQWEAGWESLKARIAGADASGTGNRVQSRFVADDGTVWALMADGQRQQLTDAQGQPIKADRQMWLRDHPGMEPHLVGKDARITPVGGQPPMGAAPGSAQAPVPQGGGQGFVDDSLALANQMIAAGIPAEQVDAFLQQRMNPAPQSAPQSPVLAPPLNYTGGGLARPSEAQTAAEVEAAKQAAQLAALPQRQAIETQGKIDQMRAESAIKPTKAQEAVDSQYGKDYVEFISGGAADANKALGELDAVIKQIEGGANLTGPVLGALPKFVKDRVASEAAAAQETVESTVQRSLRAILGAQFTEKEGERLIARAYNPSLPESENLIRVRRLFQQLQEGFENKAAAARYYEQNGTLRGFTGKLPSWGDFNVDSDSPRQPANGGGMYGPAPTDGAPPTQRARNPQTGEVLELRNGQWVPAQ